MEKRNYVTKQRTPDEEGPSVDSMIEKAGSMFTNSKPRTKTASADVYDAKSIKDDEESDLAASGK